MDDVKKLWSRRDRVTRGMTKNGSFRIACVQCSVSSRNAQERHNLDPLHALVLARMLAGSTLLASMLKGEERIVIDASGDGVIARAYAEAMPVGEVRGFVINGSKPNPDAKSPLGTGILKVQRVLYGKSEPVTGIVEMLHGDVTSDLSHYLTQSEQVPSTFVIDVVFDENDKIKETVGILVQAMPGAKPEEIYKIYDTIDYLGRLTQFVNDGYGPDDIIRQLMDEEVEIVATAPVDFFCRCSLDKFKGMLLTLGLDEIRGMEKDGQNELVCQYCSAKYYLSPDDFKEMEQQLLVARN